MEDPTPNAQPDGLSAASAGPGGNRPLIPPIWETVFDDRLGRSLRRVARLACRLMNVQLATVTLADGKTRFSQSFAPTGGLLGTIAHGDVVTSLCSRVLQAARPTTVMDVNDGAATADDRRLADVGMAAYAAVPLHANADSRLHGVICVIASEPRDWSPDDLAVLRDLADVAGSEIAACVYREATEIADRRFQAVSEGVKDCAIFLTEPTGRVASWNDGARRLAGFEPADVIGYHWGVLFSADDRARGEPEREMSGATQSHGYVGEGWRQCRDGSRFWAGVSVVPFYCPKGRLRGYVNVIRDATDTTGNRVARRSDGQSATVAERARDEFLARASFELRTHLTPVLAGVATLAEDPAVPDAARAMLRVVRRNVEQEARLIDRFIRGTQAGIVPGAPGRSGNGNGNGNGIGEGD